VVGRQNADIANTCTQGMLSQQPSFGILYMGCTLAPLGKYDWTIHAWRWCSLMSNYFDHLL